VLKLRVDHIFPNIIFNPAYHRSEQTAVNLPNCGSPHDSSSWLVIYCSVSNEFLPVLIVQDPTTHYEYNASYQVTLVRAF